jgi:hypothetical protein
MRLTCRAGLATRGVGGIGAACFCARNIYVYIPIQQRWHEEIDAVSIFLLDHEKDCCGGGLPEIKDKIELTSGAGEQRNKMNGAAVLNRI